MGDVTDELKAAVDAARASRKKADDDHERVKELLIRHRREKPDDGPADLEAMTDKYFDRATISRLTAPQFGDNPPRKPTRRRTGS